MVTFQACSLGSSCPNGKGKVEATRRCPWMCHIDEKQTVSPGDDTKSNQPTFRTTWKLKFNKQRHSRHMETQVPSGRAGSDADVTSDRETVYITCVASAPNLNLLSSLQKIAQKWLNLKWTLMAAMMAPSCSTLSPQWTSWWLSWLLQCIWNRN